MNSEEEEETSFEGRQILDTRQYRRFVLREAYLDGAFLGIYILGMPNECMEEEDSVFRGWEPIAVWDFEERRDAENTFGTLVGAIARGEWFLLRRTQV